eukprot:3501021-Rhodomonas_salina.1
MSGHQIAQRLQQLRSVYAFSSTVILESLTTGIDAVSETLVPISRDDIFIKKHDEAADTDAKNEVGNEEDEGEIATGPSPEHHPLPQPPEALDTDSTAEPTDPAVGDDAAGPDADAEAESGALSAEERPSERADVLKVEDEAAGESATGDAQPLAESELAQEGPGQEEAETGTAKEEVEPAMRDRVSAYCVGMWARLQQVLTPTFLDTRSV